MTFDMILVVAGEDYRILDIVVRNSNKYICPNNIYIITPKKDINIHEERFLNFPNVIFIDEREIVNIDKIDFEKFNLPGFPNRRFWYYQQFLKMGFSYSKYCKSDYYLIWDADTIPLNPLKFISNDNKIFLTISDGEYHKEYFTNIHKILNKKIQIYHKSFISQHLFVKKEHMINLIKQIGDIEKQEWINSLLSKLSGKSQSLFSEYETYANFVLNFYKDEYVVRKLSWFRRGAFLVNDINDLNKLSKYYDYIAIEKTDKSILKSFYFNLFHLINVLLSKKHY